MQQLIQPAFIIRLAEDSLTQRGAIQRTVRQQHFITKTFGDRGQGRGARFDNLSGDHIGIDDGCAVARKGVRYGRLAAAYSPGQRNNIGHAVRCTRIHKKIIEES